MYAQVFSLHAALFKALAHPKRLEVIHLLRDQELNVSQMRSMLGLEQANLSQHLQVLRTAGVVDTRREGKQVFYRLAHPNVIAASDLFREMLIEQHQGETLADELVTKMKDLVPLVKDPVCGMRLSPKTASFARQHQHQTYYFCAEGCYHQFTDNPDQFITTNQSKPSKDEG